MSEEYSIEWYRWLYVNNPKWLGTQALKLWEHYAVLEAKLEAIRATALQLEDDLDGTAFLDHDRNDAHDLESAAALFRLVTQQEKEDE